MLRSGSKWQVLDLPFGDGPLSEARQKYMKPPYGPLWAITAFFNPMRSERRLSNYHRFRAALTVPLATVELGFTERWELGPDAADYYVRIADGDVLWQKERLLNLLLPKLPTECEHVAWIDCDLLLMTQTGQSVLSRPLPKHRWCSPSAQYAI